MVNGRGSTTHFLNGDFKNIIEIFDNRYPSFVTKSLNACIKDILEKSKPKRNKRKTRATMQCIQNKDSDSTASTESSLTSWPTDSDIQLKQNTTDSDSDMSKEVEFTPPNTILKAPQHNFVRSTGKTNNCYCKNFKFEEEITNMKKELAEKIKQLNHLSLKLKT